jgi:hypothetical protein
VRRRRPPPTEPAPAPASAAPAAPAASGRRIKRTHLTEVGTLVEVTYRVVDAEHAVVELYRRKKRGHDQFRRAALEEGHLVRLDQLPFSTDPDRTP